jgi:hypothetical protein
MTGVVLSDTGDPSSRGPENRRAGRKGKGEAGKAENGSMGIREMRKE